MTCRDASSETGHVDLWSVLFLIWQFVVSAFASQEVNCQFIGAAFFFIYKLIFFVIGGKHLKKNELFNRQNPVELSV